MKLYKIKHEFSGKFYRGIGWSRNQGYHLLLNNEGIFYNRAELRHQIDFIIRNTEYKSLAGLSVIVYDTSEKGSSEAIKQQIKESIEKNMIIERLRT